MNHRGVSISVSHVLAIGITTILISGLMIAGTSFVSNERTKSIENTLQTEGSRLASEITAVDQAVQEAKAHGSVSTVNVSVFHPRSIAGYSYQISLVDEGECSGDTNTSISCLELRSDSPRGPVTRSIPFRNETPIRDSQVRGGPVLIRANNSSLWIIEGEP